MTENRYERLSARMKDWYEKKVDVVAKGLMGGERPPFAVRMTPEMKRAFLDRLSPEEAAQFWEMLTEREQNVVRQLMNSPQAAESQVEDLPGREVI